MQRRKINTKSDFPLKLPPRLSGGGGLISRLLILKICLSIAIIPINQLTRHVIRRRRSIFRVKITPAKDLKPAMKKLPPPRPPISDLGT
ncbi:MAG: hypothetical protein ACR2OW_00780 [Methyloligellaceae bacterium]